MKKDFFHTGLQVGRNAIQSLVDGLGPGNIWYVDYGNGNDSNGGESWDDSFKTLTAAHGAATTNNHDVIMVKGVTNVVETTMVTISKNHLTIVGVGSSMGHFGQGAAITSAIATGATNIATVKNTGEGNTFIGLRFVCANTVAEGIYAFADDGTNSTFIACGFLKTNDLDVTGAADFLCNAITSQFYNCNFGSPAYIVADDMIRPKLLLTEVLTQACSNIYLENCTFLCKTAGVEHVMVYGANATDVEEILIMNGCSFINNVAGAADPAHAVGFGAAQTAGSVLLKDCSSVLCTVMAEAAVGIYVDGAVPTFATSGVSVTA